MIVVKKKNIVVDICSLLMWAQKTVLFIVFYLIALFFWHLLAENAFNSTSNKRIFLVWKQKHLKGNKFESNRSAAPVHIPLNHWTLAR